MILENLIDYLDNSKKIDELYETYKVNTDSEAILVYMEHSLSLNSEIFLFDIEETEDKIQYKKNNTLFIQLFPVEYAIELLDDLNLKNQGLSNLDIANRLLQYRINDA